VPSSQDESATRVLHFSRKAPDSHLHNRLIRCRFSRVFLRWCSCCSLPADLGSSGETHAGSNPASRISRLLKHLWWCTLPLRDQRDCKGILSGLNEGFARLADPWYYLGTTKPAAVPLGTARPSCVEGISNHSIRHERRIEA
jgi:hypothetical protein